MSVAGTFRTVRVLRRFFEDLGTFVRSVSLMGCDIVVGDLQSSLSTMQSVSSTDAHATN